MMGTIPMARDIARTRSSKAIIFPFQDIRRLGFVERTNIPIRWTHRRRCDAEYHLDGLACPSELGDYLRVCQ
jgi:hypothetical protein